MRWLDDISSFFVSLLPDLLILYNTGECDTAAYFSHFLIFGLNFALHNKTCRVKQKQVFFFLTDADRQKATGFLKCFGIFPIPTLQAEAQKRGRGENSGRDAKEVGQRSEQGTHKGGGLKKKESDS